MVWALKEMKSAKIGNNSVMVQFDPLGDEIPVQRYVIKKGSELYNLGRSLPKNPRDPFYQDFRDWKRKQKSDKKFGSRGELEPENTGSPIPLLEFMWSSMEPQAKIEENDQKLYNILILSGHGSGFDGDFLPSNRERSDSLTIQELAVALADIKHLTKRNIDILGMDSCLMSTAEVYYQICNSVDYLVASEGYEPNTGWPYDAILDKLGSHGNDPETVAQGIVKAHTAFYFDYALGGQSVDLTACNVGLHENLKTALTSFGEVLKDAVDHPVFRDAIILAHWRAQSYKSDQYVDLGDFAEVLKDEVAKIHADAILECKLPENRKEASGECNHANIKDSINNACRQIEDAIKTIVLKSGYIGPTFQYSRGLSIYFPWARVLPNYEKLDLSIATQWHKFLERYVTVTRRECRPGYPASGGLLSEVMNPEGGTPAWPLWSRTDDPYSRTDDPYSRGKLFFKSMKNPPISWRACDLLKTSGAALSMLLKKEKENGKQ